jgi:hypothetical protein
MLEARLKALPKLRGILREQDTKWGQVPPLALSSCWQQRLQRLQTAQAFSHRK